MSLSAREQRILSKLECDLAAPSRMPTGADFRRVATMTAGLVVGIAIVSAGLVLGIPSMTISGAALTRLGPLVVVCRASASRRGPSRSALSCAQTRLRGQCLLVMSQRTSKRLAEEGT
jgi:hypothetical protein